MPAAICRASFQDAKIDFCLPVVFVALDHRYMLASLGDEVARGLTTFLCDRHFCRSNIFQGKGRGTAARAEHVRLLAENTDRDPFAVTPFDKETVSVTSQLNHTSKTSVLQRKSSRIFQAITG